MKKRKKIEDVEDSGEYVWRSNLSGQPICFIFADLTWINLFDENLDRGGLKLRDEGEIIGDK